MNEDFDFDNSAGFKHADSVVIELFIESITHLITKVHPQQKEILKRMLEELQNHPEPPEKYYSILLQVEDSTVTFTYSPESIELSETFYELGDSVERFRFEYTINGDNVEEGNLWEFQEVLMSRINNVQSSAIEINEEDENE